MTADEIAAQAGVSPASVRRVLDWTTANRGNGRVSTATLEKLAGVR
jgi:DNA-binding LacI/PurR family transcriptional regulator